MKYRFFNAQILSQNKILKGEVVVENDKIVFVGEKAPKQDYDREIDVKNNLLMAGFVNSHAHTPSTVLRATADDVELLDFLNTIVPLERSLTDEDVYWSVMLGVAEYVRGGITAVEEDYARIEPITMAYKKAKFRARISIGYPNFMQTEKVDMKKQLEFVKSNGFNAVCFAHSPYGTDEKFFDEMVCFAKQNNLETCLHLSETLKEVGDISVKYDKTPVELIEDYGFLDRTCTCYHAVHADKDDLKILSDYKANVVTCPSSNAKLASGIAPLYAMQNLGINIGIGTDGAYSNNNYDMFKEMFLVATLNKAILYKPDILKAGDVLDMATKNGGKIIGYKVGEILPEYLADIILINLNSPHFHPQNNLISNLVYSAKSSDVYFTMVGGNILYENGKYNIGESIEDIYSHCNEIAKKLNILEK